MSITSNIVTRPTNNQVGPRPPSEPPPAHLQSQIRPSIFNSQLFETSVSSTLINSVFPNNLRPIPSPQQIAALWSKHRTFEGFIYYYNIITQESTWERPAAYVAYRNGLKELTTRKSKLESVEKKRACALEPIAGSSWCIAYVDDGRIFYYDTSTKKSSWKIPDEINSQENTLNEEVENDIDHTNHNESVDIGLTTEVAANESSSIEADEKLSSNLQEQNDAQDFAQLPLNSRIQLFHNLLKENDINPYSIWEKEFLKIENDYRFHLLESSGERQDAFDIHCRDLVSQLKKEQKPKPKTPQESFKELFKSSKLTPKSTFVEFYRKNASDERCRRIGMKEREQIFKEYIYELKEEEEYQKVPESVIKEYRELLSETKYIQLNSEWKDIKLKIQYDARFKKIGSTNLCEKLFEKYRTEIKSSVPRRDSSSEHDNQIRIKREEVSLKKRERQAMSEMEKLTGEMEQQKQILLHDSICNIFKTLLTEIIHNQNIDWNEAYKELKKNERFQLCTSLNPKQMRTLFDEYIAALEVKLKKSCKSVLYEITNKLNLSWEDISERLCSDKRVQMWTKDKEIIKDFFYSFMNNRRKLALQEFQDLLKETSYIEFNMVNSMESKVNLDDIRKALANDKRYIMLDPISDMREQLLVKYIQTLQETALAKKQHTISSNNIG